MKRKTSFLNLAGALALCLTGGVSQAQITAGLVVHLPFDDDYNNTRGNVTATAVGSPKFGEGRIGKAVAVTTLKDGSQFDYVTLSASPLLDFGSVNDGNATDFTVAFWCNYTNQVADPAIISNKDWSSSDNPGWGIFAQGGGNLRVNVTDDVRGKLSTTDTPVVRDGKWHHVAVAFARATVASIFVDGKLASTASLDPVKSSLEAGLALNIGQDGTGQYTDGGGAEHVNMLIDDLGIWRRALSAGEVSAIYDAGLAGNNLTTVAVIPASVDTIVPTDAPRQGNQVSSSITITLSDGGTTIDDNSITLQYDGKAVTPVKTRQGKTITVKYTPEGIAFPEEKHQAELSFKDATGATTSKSWAFYGLKNVLLPAPTIFENFDSYTEFTLPTGWTEKNFTDPATEGEDPDNLNSDTYKGWVLASKDRLTALKDRIFAGPAPNQTSNGVPVTAETLSSGNLLYAESDVRGGNQVQFLFSKPFNLSSMTNVAVGFSSLYEQNQDNIGAVEYSVDGGKSWLPIVYYLDGPDIVVNPDGTVDAVKTLTAVNEDTAAWTEDGVQKGDKYGDGIAAPITQDLAPYIAPRVNDDNVEGKRLEIHRLPTAGGKTDVRLRFAQLGTGSWYFGVDNLGFYEVPAPVSTPVEPKKIAIAVSGSNLTISWTGQGRLEEAAAVTGPWAASATQTNPQTVTPAGSAKFYRVGP
jgi:hypothetical protein